MTFVTVHDVYRIPNKCLVNVKKKNVLCLFNVGHCLERNYPRPIRLVKKI